MARARETIGDNESAVLFAAQGQLSAYIAEVLRLQVHVKKVGEQLGARLVSGQGLDGSVPLALYMLCEPAANGLNAVQNLLRAEQVYLHHALPDAVSEPQAEADAGE